MILWQAAGDESVVRDMWSSNFATPIFDKYDQLQNEIEDSEMENGRKIFKTQRALDTMDDQDFIIPLDE